MLSLLVAKWKWKSGGLFLLFGWALTEGVGTEFSELNSRNIAKFRNWDKEPLTLNCTEILSTISSVWDKCHVGNLNFRQEDCCSQHRKASLNFQTKTFSSALKKQALQQEWTAPPFRKCTQEEFWENILNCPSVIKQDTAVFCWFRSCKRARSLCESGRLFYMDSAIN